MPALILAALVDCYEEKERFPDSGASLPIWWEKRTTSRFSSLYEKLLSNWFVSEHELPQQWTFMQYANTVSSLANFRKRQNVLEHIWEVSHWLLGKLFSKQASNYCFRIIYFSFLAIYVHQFVSASEPYIKCEQCWHFPEYHLRTYVLQSEKKGRKQFDCQRKVTRIARLFTKFFVSNCNCWSSWKWPSWNPSESEQVFHIFPGSVISLPGCHTVSFPFLRSSWSSFRAVVRCRCLASSACPSFCPEGRAPPAAWRLFPWLDCRTLAQHLILWSRRQRERERQKRMEGKRWDSRRWSVSVLATISWTFWLKLAVLVSNVQDLIGFCSMVCNFKNLGDTFLWAWAHGHLAFWRCFDLLFGIL